MKKILSRVAMAFAAVILLASCGVTSNLTFNANQNQTNVVLSQKNYHVVKTVKAEVSATYICGIGGLSKQALQNNVIAELTKEAGLTGSQALINVTVHNSGKMFLVYNKLTYHAEATIIEFDE